MERIFGKILAVHAIKTPAQWEQLLFYDFTSMDHKDEH